MTRTGTFFAPRQLAPAAAVLALLILTLAAAAPSPAAADGQFFGGCVGWRGSFNCAARWGLPTDPYVRLVPQPADKAEVERAQQRDHEWTERCQPVVAHDRYGVARYIYAKPGCEYGSESN